MSTATFIVGDVRAVLATLPAASVDLVVTSPPFLLQREYLPMDHDLKAFEIGREEHPAAFVDALLTLVVDLDRVLAPHGSIAMELGDTHSGSGGAGGDYNVGGWREGQPRYAGSGSAARPGGGFRPNHGAEERGMWSPKKRTLNPPPTWPMAKSLALVPELFRVALAYGRNPLTGAESPAGRWIIRNVVRWVRVNPSPGSDGDKFRRATSDIVIATRSPRRYFDGEVVRVPGYDGNGAPLLDWWEISAAGYEGAHFATFPPSLVVPLIRSMCPERVCRQCNQPSRRVLDVDYESHGDPATHNAEPKATADYVGQQRQQNAQGMTYGRATKRTETVAWTICGHADWRRGVVLDPFGGSGTVGAVATGQARDAVLIDIDERNVKMAADRIGMFGEFFIHLDVPIPGASVPVRVPT